MECLFHVDLESFLHNCLLETVPLEQLEQDLVFAAFLY